LADVRSNAAFQEFLNELQWEAAISFRGLTAVQPLAVKA
jgi:hypothetical protein